MKRYPINHLLLCTSAILSACSGTTWTHARAVPNYQAPKQISVAISVQAEGEGINEAVWELRESIDKELRSSGITAVFVATVTTRPSAELRVVQWNMGDRWKRYWLSKDGEGYIVVTVRVTLPNDRPGYYGVTRGHVDGGFFGGSCLNSASAAGESIAKAIATGAVQ